MYPVENERISGNHTFAIRDLVESAQHFGANIRHIIRFRPLVSLDGICLPHMARAGQLDVLDVPRVGVRSWFSGRMTHFLMGRIETPDTAVCHMTSNFLSACKVFRQSKTKLIYVVHASDLADPCLRDCLKRADAVYCRSEAIRNRLASTHGVDTDGVVYSGVATSDYGNPARDSTGNELKVVIATQLIPLRNVAATIFALSQLRNEIRFDADIYGDGELYGQISGHIERLGLKHAIRMHGFRPRIEVLDAMRNAHMFIMPSAPETFGLAYLEAMAQGCVVIGHEGWGIDGIVKDGVNGYLVASPEPAHIAEKILAYMRSSRQGMHDASFQTATRYTAENAGRNYAEMIKSHCD